MATRCHVSGQRLAPLAKGHLPLSLGKFQGRVLILERAEERDRCEDGRPGCLFLCSPVSCDQLFGRTKREKLNENESLNSLLAQGNVLLDLFHFDAD